MAPGLCIGAKKGMPLFKAVLDKYASLNFYGDDGTFNKYTMIPMVTDFLIAEGMQPHNRVQRVAGFTIYPSEYFNPLDAPTGRMTLTPNTRSIHWFMASWLPKQPKWKKKLNNTSEESSIYSRNNMPLLTIFTPAYNRAHTIGRTYESLLRQTCKDFEWLIVDDGSTDNTRELVESWIKEDKIPIRYICQDNQGMHGAHNTAYRNISTELNTCIDSDDFMPDEAVEKIIRFWKEHGSDKYAGIVGLDQTEDGKIIGAPFPESLKETTLQGYYAHGGSGDKNWFIGLM